jgi:hypothetical protein
MARWMTDYRLSIDSPRIAHALLSREILDDHRDFEWRLLRRAVTTCGPSYRAQLRADWQASSEGVDAHCSVNELHAEWLARLRERVEYCHDCGAFDHTTSGCDAVPF